MMLYNTIQPPFSLKFRDMSKDELLRYFSWFLEVAPERIEQLKTAVHTTAGFEDTPVDFTSESFPGLGEWFAAVVETKQRTGEEIEETKLRTAYAFPVAQTELSNRTFSIAMDMGMYFAEVMLSKYPHLTWDQPLSDKKFADYGQPVLVGAGPVPLNPVRLMVTLAYGVAAKTQTGARLTGLFEYWSKRAALQP